MKNSILIAAVVVFVANLSDAQAGDFAVTERGANYQVLQKTTYENGTNRVHRYTQLATGLNYTNSSGQLVESKEQISILPNGGAAATNGQHKVIFPSDIYDGVLEVTTPDGRHLKSRPIGVSFDDGSNMVWIAGLQHSMGWLTASNQVTYPDAFTDVKADLVCTYRRGGFECDLVFREKPQTPDAYGLEPSASTLQLVTEFFNTQDPQEIPAGYDEWYGLQDTTLKFGALTMASGKAFAVSSTNSQPSTAVYKTWTHIEGRTFLIEQVPLVYLADDLSTLPEATNALISKLNVRPWLRVASNKRQLPPAREFVAATNQIQIASADFNKQPGVVLDYYVELNSDQTDFTFEANTTYFVDNWVTISGTATFEGGAVIKFPEHDWSGIYCGHVVCDTTAYSPAIFTSQNDNSVGETIDGSSGSPAEGDYTYLQCNNPFNLDHCRFSYAATAVVGGSVFNDCQFAQCYYGIVSGNIELKNSLASGCYYFIDNSAVCENDTFDNDFCAADQDSTFTNCIFSNVGYVVYDFYNYGATNNGSHNGFYDTPTFGDNPVSFDGNYQSGTLGNYYLSTNSACIGAGNVTADQAGLYWFTTQTNQTIEGMTPVDLGYHYPAVDGEGDPVETDTTDYDHVQDYLQDENGNGLPDWWETLYFGNFNHHASELDPLGNTLFYDYTNYINLSVVEFSVRVGNRYFNTTNATGSYEILSGVPAYQSVLVNTDNVANAIWTNYDGIIRMNLGSTDGVYQVWFGLKGLATNTSPVWTGTDIYLDRVAPTLHISNPATNMTAVPVLQLQGWSPEELKNVSFDLSNAVVVITNQYGSLTGQFLDTNVLAWTTNYFQCYDIPLTNGLNTIKVHATDLAGNVTTTNINLTLDYSSATNPPSIQLFWPKQGEQICGTNFTWHGWVSDPTATVTTQVVNTNGTTNVVNALVERNGNFWAENLPMSGGTNCLILTVTDSAGNINVTNITISPNPLTVTMTPIPDDQLWNSKVTASGTISDSTYSLWINGVKATVANATWSATQVPMTDGGKAVFDITTYAPGETQPDGSHSN